MTGAIRRYWWLLLGLALAVIGAASIASVGRSHACSEFGVNGQLLSGGNCEDEFAALQRTYILGLILLILGLLTIAFGLGYRLGRRGQRPNTDRVVAA